MIKSWQACLVCCLSVCCSRPWPVSEPSKFTLTNTELLYFSTIFPPKNPPSCCPSTVFSHNYNNNNFQTPTYLLSTQKKAAKETTILFILFHWFPLYLQQKRQAFLRNWYCKNLFLFILPSYFSKNDLFFFFFSVDTSNPKQFLLHLTCLLLF